MRIISMPYSFGDSCQQNCTHQNYQYCTKDYESPALLFWLWFDFFDFGVVFPFCFCHIYKVI